MKTNNFNVKNSKYDIKNYLFRFKTDTILHKICSHCSTKDTPAWRKNINKDKYLCNACGLYEKAYGKKRPLIFKDGKIRVKKKREEFTFCILCDYVCKNVNLNVKHICRKCKSDFNLFDLSMFNVLKFECKDPSLFQYKKTGSFFKFNLYF
ncbi:GATA zinc finger domain-containing protein [Tubulinosema ratisbonensis]|uniref:GATA zinc finger domain-containing protein n=1 Tax=Tubulinosema ratisbonensis TaxID=291195 RepID=A0A437AL29_9MICR|nr:GATA zinc finger domain-containing protein [Tubulinosema ratisbonensis]